MSAVRESHTLGIDFGTSNSAAGIAVNGMPRIIEIEPGNTTLPTSVFFDFARREMQFGTTANTALIDGQEGRYLRALKSVLGTSLMAEKRYIMGEELTFFDIIGRFLSAVKSNAETATGRVFDLVLSGRPVHFHSNDAVRDKRAERDLRECYLRAGFDDVRFMFEPEAAALANGALANGRIGLIVDIGGGTSDFCLFGANQNAETTTPTIDILASHGVRVGGTDFDKSISVDHVMTLFGKGAVIGRELGPETDIAPNAIFQDLATWQKIPFLYSGSTRRDVAQLQKLAQTPVLFARLASILELELGHDVAFAVEQSKIEVNQYVNDISAIDLNVVEPGLFRELSSSDLAFSLRLHVDKIATCARETLEMAMISPNQVDQVIFVGGSGLMSAIEQAMVAIFPHAELKYADAFTAIVDGLAIAASGSFAADNA